MSTIIKLIPSRCKKVFVKTEGLQIITDKKGVEKTRVIEHTYLLDSIRDAAAYIAVQQQQEKCEIVDYTGEYPPPT